MRSSGANGGGVPESELRCNGCWAGVEPGSSEHWVATQCQHLYCMACFQTVKWRRRCGRCKGQRRCCLVRATSPAGNTTTTISRCCKSHPCRCWRATTPRAPYALRCAGAPTNAAAAATKPALRLHCRGTSNSSNRCMYHICPLPSHSSTAGPKVQRQGGAAAGGRARPGADAGGAGAARGDGGCAPRHPVL